MQRRRRGRTMQGMYSPADSLRDNYEMGRDIGSRKQANKVVSVPGYSSGSYKKDT